MVRIRAQLLILYRDKNGTYVFWPCSLLVLRCPLHRRYSINGPTIYFAIVLSLKRIRYGLRERDFAIS